MAVARALSLSCLLCAVAGGFVAADASVGSGPVQAPQWPKAFSANYVSPKEAKDTVGLYAISQSGELVTFEDGSRDHLCRKYHSGTSCSILTTRGYKYLVYPKLEKCCKCCSYKNGCGPVGQKWLSNATGNMQYVDRIQGAHGQWCDRWSVYGLSPNLNYYSQFVESGKPCEVDGWNWLDNPSQLARDTYVFDSATYSEEVSESTFDLPQYCESASLCGAPVCDTSEDEELNQQQRQQQTRDVVV